MSQTTVFVVPREGAIAELASFGNAWGSAMRVWISLVDAYVADKSKGDQGRHEALGAFVENGDLVFDLKYDRRLSRCERASLLWTFDKAIVRRERLKEIADLFFEFDRMHPAAGVNHLPAIADLYIMAAALPPTEVLGLCVVQTSVACDVWRVPIEGDDESRLFDFSIDGLDHSFFVFDELKLIEGAIA